MVHQRLSEAQSSIPGAGGGAFRASRCSTCSGTLLSSSGASDTTHLDGGINVAGMPAMNILAGTRFVRSEEVHERPAMGDGA